jgi:hypothetical protein
MLIVRYGDINILLNINLSVSIVFAQPFLTRIIFSHIYGPMAQFLAQSCQ